jgi:hypothetical protein
MSRITGKLKVFPSKPTTKPQPNPKNPTKKPPPEISDEDSHL